MQGSDTTTDGRHRNDPATMRRLLEILREREVELARIEKAVAVFARSLEEFAARETAAQAEARAVETEERVSTVRESEAARRRKAVEVTAAEAAAEETRIAAEAQRLRALVDAEAQRLVYEAENTLTDSARYGLFRRRLLDRIEGIVRESVKPMEKIEGIRILQVDGLNGNGNGHGGSRSPTDEVIDSALRYRVQAPMIDQVMKEIGIEGGSLARLGGLMREASDMQRVAKDAGAGRPDGEAKPPRGDGAKG